jgi:hypothetical protein
MVVVVLSTKRLCRDHPKEPPRLPTRIDDDDDDDRKDGFGLGGVVGVLHVAANIVVVVVVRTEKKRL